MLPPLAYFSFLWVKRIRPIYRSMSEDQSAIDARVSETFGGIRVVRAYVREKKEEYDYSIKHHTIIRKRILANLLELSVDGGWNLLIPLTGLIIIWLGGIMLLSKQVSMGDIIAFQMYSAMLLTPVWRIVYSLSQIQRALASTDRVFEIMNLPEEEGRFSGITLTGPVQSIQFEGVHFHYDEKKKVIHDFSLRVQRGSVVALVGPSGAGKSTLMDLLARFHIPAKGRILINDQDLSEINMQSYRRHLGIVQQEVFLFDGTVSENIAYGLPSASAADIQEAARRANAHNFIQHLPERYETFIGERGYKLSGGERQRISIARAILADPRNFNSG